MIKTGIKNALVTICLEGVDILVRIYVLMTVRLSVRIYVYFDGMYMCMSMGVLVVMCASVCTLFLHMSTRMFVCMPLSSLCSCC